MALRRIARMIFPLAGKGQICVPITQTFADEAIRNALTQTNGKVFAKPGRRVGAGWIADFVALRKNVNLCESCWRRYGHWWKRHNYRADWAGWMTDCDGCGRLTQCNGFYPAENIALVLHPRFWKEGYQPQYEVVK